MNTTDAIRLMVRHYPGGMAVIAMRLGKSPNTLEKELRGESSHKLGLVDACAISSMCIEDQTPHCRAYANAVAGECGGFVELEVRDDMRRQDLRIDLASMLKEASDTAASTSTCCTPRRTAHTTPRPWAASRATTRSARWPGSFTAGPRASRT